MTPVEFREDRWLQKTRLPVLSCGVVCVILSLAVLVEHRLVTDGQTDRRTDTGPWLVPRIHGIARLQYPPTATVNGVSNYPSVILSITGNH